MKNRSWFLPFLLSGFLIGIVNQAHPTDISVSGYGDLLGMVNTDYGVSAIDGRLDVQFHISPATVGIDYRSYDFGHGRYNPAGIDRFQGIKHRFAEVGQGGYLIRAGHTSVTFARGLALRSFEERQLEHDNLIDGVLVKYSGWGLSLDALGGSETERVSKTQSIEHRIRGLRLSGRLSNLLEIGVCGVERSSVKRDQERQLPPDLANFEDRLLGVDVWLSEANFSINGDYVYRQGDSYGKARHGIEGHGFYGSLGLFLEPASILVEYKDYWDFAHALSMGPTCIKEHPWSLMGRVMHESNYTDEKGFLIEAMASIRDNLHVSAGASESRNHDGKLNHWEMFWEIQPPEGLLAKAIGFSWSREYTRFEETWTFDEYMTLAWQIQVKPKGKVCLVDAEMQRVRQPYQNDFLNYRLSSTFYLTDLISTAFTFETTDEPNARKDLWVFGETRIQIENQTEVGLGIGSEPAGKKCSGGICYIQPEFAGIKIRLSRYF